MSAKGNEALGDPRWSRRACVKLKCSGAQGWLAASLARPWAGSLGLACAVEVGPTEQPVCWRAFQGGGSRAGRRLGSP